MPLKERQTAEPADPAEWKNVYRIVRADMRMHKLVLDLYAKYKKALTAGVSGGET